MPGDFTERLLRLAQFLGSEFAGAMFEMFFRRVQVPPNGLVVYTGTVMTEDGKEKKMNIDFDPFKTINTSL